MKRLLALTALTLGSAAPLAAQSLIGVWKPVEVVLSGGPDAGRHTTDLQPGQAIFTGQHYATLYVSGFAPRPRLSTQPTDEERGKVFDKFIANAGTYQLKDSVLSYTPVVAKNPATMSGTTYTMFVRIRADSAWFTSRAATTGIETQSKWIRTEKFAAK